MFQKVLDERSELIEGGIKKAEEAQAEAKEALEQYRAQLAEARTELHRSARRPAPRASRSSPI